LFEEKELAGRNSSRFQKRVFFIKQLNILSCSQNTTEYENLKAHNGSGPDK